MSNASERGRGKAEKIGGAIKKNVGKLIGNEQMEAEGALLELKGEARQKLAKVAERTKGVAEEVAGAIKMTVGGIVDDELMQAEGKLKELKGKARQKANQ